MKLATIAAAAALLLFGSASAETAPIFLCLPFPFNFDFDASGAPTATGAYAEDVIWPMGAHIYATGAGNVNRGQYLGDERKAMLFNSTPPGSGGDSDLVDPLGLEKHILIISEDNDQGDPDDNNGAGTLVFEFQEPIKINDIGFLDLEENRRRKGTIKLFDEMGGTILSENTPIMADGEKKRMPLEKEGVSKIEVYLAGSGAITDLELCTLPGVFGDPHFTLWSGESYEYHGVCDLLFVESPANNLTIHLRTSQLFHYSYVSSAAIRLNDDVFEFGSWGQVIRNGMFEFEDDEVYDIPKSFGGHKLTKVTNNKKTHTYMIEFGNGGGIEVKSFKDMVAVRLIGSSAHFTDAVGLMGSPLDGRRLGRHGQVIRDDNAFGQEWQILENEPKLFEDQEREPQAPRPCHVALIPETRRRLGESAARQKAEEACAKWPMNKQACVEDVMVTGELELAAAFYD